MPIFKDPATDEGSKTSAYGLLRVNKGRSGELVAQENVNWNEEAGGALRTIYIDGEEQNIQTLAGIREQLETYL